MLIESKTLERFVSAIFTTAGAESAAADQVAAHLVEANLKGHDSHGVGMVPAYIGNLRAGHLQPAARATLTRDQGAVMLFDGGFGFGQVVGAEATTQAIARARETGIVCAGVRNCHHLGRIGSYGEQCGEAGMISVHFVNVVGHAPLVTAFGGRERRMTTNPFCCVIPRADDKPIVLDMATSAVAMGKVRVAHMKGERVPDGALVDHEGLATTDPAVMYQEPFGALGPFGAHKGYGLAVMCELLGGALAGEWTAQPGNPRDNTIVNHMLMFVLDPAAFGGLENFRSEVKAMVDYLHSSQPARGNDRVRIPGEPEQEALAARIAEGVPIDDNSWSSLLQAAQAAGLSDSKIQALIPAA
ncbi:MAG: malate/lactate/ureidoglycolate dehydrogenase [Pseudomonadales bacterium]